MFLGVTLPVPGAVAATLDILAQTRHGAWAALEMRNGGSGERLCAAEVRLPDGAYFRLNYYSPVNSFAEIHPLPRSGAMGAGSLIFESDAHQLRVDAARHADAWVVELTDRRMTGALALVLGAAERLTIRDGGAGFEVPVKGARQALAAFAACTRRLHVD